MHRYISFPVLLFFPALMLIAVEAMALEGHIKFQQQYSDSRDNSINNFFGEPTLDTSTLDVRLIVRRQINNWQLTAHYQLNNVSGNSLSLQDKLYDAFPQSHYDSSSAQWFDLQNTIRKTDGHVLTQKLDRAYIGYNRRQLVIKLGRQALSWGNGLVFRPMDLFNPFPPDAIDNSYKPGIDMLYGQWLFDSGSDLSALIIPRRDIDSKQLSHQQASTAIRFQHFGDMLQSQFILANDYQDHIIGVGVYGPLKDAVWRLDLVATGTSDNRNPVSFIFNMDTAWQWQQKSFYGFVEIYRNGFGMDQANYTLEELPADLLQRLARGQLFNTGRDYLATGLRLQWSPLLELSPLLVFNLNDHSQLLFLQGNFSLSQNITLDFGASLGRGRRGSEFYGVETSPGSGIYLQTGQQLFARLSYYF